MSADLLATDWNQLYTVDNLPTDIHDSCRIFMSQLDYLYCKNFPLKIKYISSKRNKNRWLTPDLKKLMSQKSIVYKKSHLGLISREESNSFRNRVNMLVRKAKSDYYKNSFSAARSDMKKNWSLIHDLIGSKQKKSHIDKIIVDNNVYSDPQDISNVFNEYFSTVATNLANELPSHTTENALLGLPCTNSYYLFEISNEECLRLTSKLKNTKTDINSMPVTIFKKNSNLISHQLCYLINKSFNEGIFPNPLKIARLNPIFKKASDQIQATICLLHPSHF